MSNKNEILKIGLVTAMVAFGMIGVFVAVSAPADGIVSLAHAYRSQCNGSNPSPGTIRVCG